MKKYIEQLVAVDSRTELDLELPYSATEVDEQGDSVDIDVEWSDELRGSCFCDTTVSMEIDEAILILERLKAKGAERVLIADHADHYGYYFYGTRIEEVDVPEPGIEPRKLYSASPEVIDALQMMLDMHRHRYGLDGAFDEHFTKATAIFNRTGKV